MEDSQVWLRTPAAARSLGRSESYLKRLRDTHGGFLESGRHYMNGTSRNASIVWNIPLIRKDLLKRAVSHALPRAN